MAPSAGASRDASLGEMRRLVRVGLVGRGIQRSRTPAMHEIEGAVLGMDYSYELLDAEAAPRSASSLGEIIRKAEAEGFAGLNVTYPYKVEAIAHLQELSEAATMVGAVNTIVFRGGLRSGHNTDLWGFSQSFRQNMADAPRGEVLLIGAGGAGAAVAHALAGCGVDLLRIADIDSAKAGALAHRICERHGIGRACAESDPHAIASRLDGVVNATPMGMEKMPGSPFPGELLRSRMWVADIVYFPLETELLRMARERGCRTLPGSGMAVFQAVRAFELFTGVTPDADRMRSVFDSFDRTGPA